MWEPYTLSPNPQSLPSPHLTPLPRISRASNDHRLPLENEPEPPPPSLFKPTGAAQGRSRPPTSIPHSPSLVLGSNTPVRGTQIQSPGPDLRRGPTGHRFRPNSHRGPMFLIRYIL